MANHTQKLILSTFQEMLEEMPFYKITVSTLVKRCGISPNTFYYHYEDIYALLDVWVAAWANQFTPQDDWRKNAREVLHFCQDHPKLVGHILNYLTREQIEQVVFSIDEDDLLYNFVRKSAENTNISEQKQQNIADFCRYAVMGFFLKFVWNHADDDVETVVDDLDSYIRCFVKAALEKATNQLNASIFCAMLQNSPKSESFYVLTGDILYKKDMIDIIGKE
ncbi:MAG: TetR/AcrR family transcriptional regulator C-terminal domain-containing protein [Anaerolineaceae bacterium]|nr:TetR/AcrR family transcriptional regulator C-terminal domain-containing protein [Anaerolineaceae bacterium]